jgi:hypothetical protein
MFKAAYKKTLIVSDMPAAVTKEGLNEVTEKINHQMILHEMRLPLRILCALSVLSV